MENVSKNFVERFVSERGVQDILLVSAANLAEQWYTMVMSQIDGEPTTPIFLWYRKPDASESITFPVLAEKRPWGLGKYELAQKAPLSDQRNLYEQREYLFELLQTLPIIRSA